MDDIKVSIICNTYNQESYIRDALNSFVMQKTDFKFEVLVHDDASTDNTPNIIKEFEEKYPDIIKPIYQTENQYSKKIPITKTFTLPRAKGKYFAYCEGDDYWTDELKLQKQYDVLEAHPDIDMCAHSTNMVSADNTEILMAVLQPSNTERVLTTEEVILGGGGYVATNSLFYRKGIYENEPPFRKMLSLDYTLQILGSLKGGIYFLTDNMSNYRYMAKGSWSTRVAANTERCIEHFGVINRMLQQLNIDTKHKYEQAINEEINKNNYEIQKRYNNNKALISAEFKNIFSKLPLKTRIKIRLKAYFPFLLDIKRKLNKK